MESLFTKTVEYILPIWESSFEGAPVKFPTSIGGSRVEKPNEALVREAVESVEVDDISTSTVPMGMGRARGAYRVQFSVPLEAWCIRADVWGASSILLNAFERLCASIAADRTLGGAVMHAEPYYSSIGTATKDKQYIAAISCGVRVKATIDPLD